MPSDPILAIAVILGGALVGTALGIALMYGILVPFLDWWDARDGR